MSAITNLIKETRDKKNKSKPVFPKDIGWIEKRLTQVELDFVWYCIDYKRSDSDGIRDNLAGNISSSYGMRDHQNLFWSSVVKPLVNDYENYYGVKSDKNLYMNTWWVNYQKQTEFNPIHIHDGVYSFVIWLKIPTRYSDQKKLPFANRSNSKTISNFVFTYTDPLGKIRSMTYEMCPEIEGTMVLFPSELNHEVYPFYNCEETRVSVSGNVTHRQ